jgi:hypothetical protein
MIDFSGLNRIFGFAQFFLRWTPGKTAHDINTTITSLESLEPDIQKLVPAIERIVNLVAPIVKEAQKIYPEVVQIWNESQPSIAAARQAYAIIEKDLPTIIDAWNKLQPVLAVVEHSVNTQKQKGIEYTQAINNVAHDFSSWVKERETQTWK